MMPLFDKLSNYCERIAMAAAVLIAAVQLWQVIARYVLNQSLAWSEPLSALLLSALMSFAAASAVYESRHFRFSWLVDQSSQKVRTRFSQLIALMTSFSCFALALKAFSWAMDGMQVKQAGLALPVGCNYLPLSLGMLLAAVFGIAQLFKPAAGASNFSEES
jgi:TRAP-type C4-dicarboxylate transport system permease small subunit